MTILFAVLAKIVVAAAAMSVMLVASAATIALASRLAERRAASVPATARDGRHGIVSALSPR